MSTTMVLAMYLHLEMLWCYGSVIIKFFSSNRICEELLKSCGPGEQTITCAAKDTNTYNLRLTAKSKFAHDQSMWIRSEAKRKQGAARFR